jgi:signal peptidase II
MTSDSPGPVATPPAPSTAVSPARTGAGRVLAYRWLLLIAICVLLLDRLTKVWICIHLPYPTYGPPGHIIVIEGLFNLVNVGNTGAAWSLFSGRSTALAILAVATLIAIYAWRRQLGLRVWIVQISFGTLCGGILGNLFDRLLYGHVIDFLDFHFGSYVYPTFNIADSGIFIGVVVYLLYSLLQRKPSQG